MFTYNPIEDDERTTWILTKLSLTTIGLVLAGIDLGYDTEEERKKDLLILKIAVISTLITSLVVLYYNELQEIIE